MGVLAPLTSFKNTMNNLRKRIPLHNELQEQVDELEARALLSRLSDVERNADAAKRFAAALSLREVSAFCRILSLPEAESMRPIWSPIANAMAYKTYYLQLRSHMPFRFDQSVFLSEFARVTGVIRENPSHGTRVERLLRSSHDDWVQYTGVRNPIEYLLDAYREHATLLGIYAADQGLDRRSPLFQKLRERWFSVCDQSAYLLDDHELRQSIQQADETSCRSMLAHFLQVHGAEDFPAELTHALIHLYGKPDESLVWEEAEMLRAEMDDGSNPPVKTGHPSIGLPGLHGLNWWFRREELRSHFGSNSLKLDLFLKYMPFLRRVSHDVDKEAILLHYTDCTVVDFQPVQHFSWVCDPSELEMRYEDMTRAMLDQEGQEPGIRRKRVPEARDFVIEQENGAVIRLAFAEVGRLYAQDLMEIRLGLKQRDVWGIM